MNEFGISSGQPGGNLRKVDWSKVNLRPFKKKFMENMVSISPQQTEAWRKEKEISVEGTDCPPPLPTFQECGFPKQFLDQFHQLGFTSPTPVQSQGWPMALTGRDIVCIAETGSGKTLGFILPGLVHINAQPATKSGDGPIALVVAPTRELACQIEVETTRFAQPLGLTMCCVYGGAPKHPQLQKLRGGVDMIIATPGRLLDFIERRDTNLDRTTFVIFDEADRMLDMGFEPQIRMILGQVRPDRQMLMWSATWPKEVRLLANDFLPNDRIVMKIGTDDGTASKRITQHVHIVSRYEKQQLLSSRLREFQGQKVLIFTGTKRMADQLSRQLQQQGYRAEAIHGDKRQEQRDHCLASFKSGRITVMVATDVASRGIHVNDISLVINYDFPQNLSDYVHRVGRTGRAGKFGTAVTFFDSQIDGKKGRGLAKILRESGQVVPPQLLTMQSGGGRRGRGGRSGGRGRSRYR